MRRVKNNGMVWRPVEYVLLGIIVLLVVFLVWTIREINRLEQTNLAKPKTSQQNENSISNLIEQDVRAEEAIDATYDTWEERSVGAVDGAADDIGGVYDETSF